MLFGWIILDGIGKTLARTWFSIWLFIDSIVYGFVSTGYQVFLLLSKVSFYNTTDDKISQITSRIYVILGVAMLFVLAYNLISLIINPDNVSSKDSKSLKGFAKNFVFSVVLLTLLPTVFNYMSKLQNDIMDSRVIEKVILGNDTTVDSNSSHDLGKEIALMVFSSFYTPIDNEGNVVTYYQCKQDGSLSSSCSLYVKYYETAQKYGIVSFIGAPELFEALFKSDGVFGFGAKVPTMQYLYFISTIVGVVVALMFTSYAIDIAVRVAKLAFLQIIAPIPVILRITKPSGGIFSKWLDRLIKTYLTLLLRRITTYSSVELIAIFADNLNFGGIIDSSLNYPVMVYIYGRILIIIGILLFAKEAPKLFNNLSGNALGEGGGFSPKSIAKKVGGITGAPLIGGALGAAGALAGKGIGAAAGAAGGAASALRNNLRMKVGGKGAAGLTNMDVKSAAVQGSAKGWKDGGGFKQFKKQGEGVYANTYGYGKKQGFMGGKSFGTTVDEKYGKAYESNVKQHAKDMNDKYIATNVEPKVPKDEAGIQNTSQNYDSVNKNFASESSAYKSAAEFVDNEAKAMGTVLTDAERKAKINDKLSQIAATTTDANEKRSIDSYLARDSIMTKYDNSVLNNNPAAIEKVKQDATIETRKIVNAEIKSKGVENVITDAAVKTTLKNNARIEVSNKISAVGGDISKISFSDEAKKQINSNITAKVTAEIQNKGGINNIALSQNAEADLQKQLSNIVSANPNLQSSDITQIEQKLRTEAVTKQVTQTVSTQVIQDYMLKDEYTKQVSDHLFNEKKDQVESYMMEQTKNAVTSEITAQIKDYEVGKVTGTYSDDVTGKLDKEYNANFVQNEKIHNDGVKSKSALDLAMDQIKEAVKEKTSETKSKPKAENDKK